MLIRGLKQVKPYDNYDTDKYFAENKQWKRFKLNLMNDIIKE